MRGRDRCDRVDGGRGRKQTGKQGWGKAVDQDVMYVMGLFEKKNEYVSEYV